MAKKKILQDNEGQIWPVTIADCVYLVDGSKTIKKYIDDGLANKAGTSHGNHVPTTQTADNTKFLRNDNTWQSVTPANIGALSRQYKTAATAATAGWYRIATSAAGIARNMAMFEIEATVSGKHSVSILAAGICYGQAPTLNQLAHAEYSATGISKARIVYHTTYNSNYAYLEVYVPTATATTLNVKMIEGFGWSLTAPNTAGSIPSGYTNKEITLVKNKIVADIQGNVSGSSGSCTGNAATATKVHTTLATTTKAYLLATSTAPTSTSTAVNTVGDTGVYLTTTAGQLSVGSLQTRGHITTSSDNSHDLGSTNSRFKGVIAANVYSYGANATHYASLRMVTEGTANAADGTAGTQGVGRLVAGNNVNAGTAGNAKGQILLYGTNTGYTTISPGYNSTSSITLTLPSSGGTLARTADALLLNGNNTMTGNIKMNNNTKITTKTATAINDTSGTAVAAGTEIAILEYNGSENLHIGRDIYEKKLTSGATYISGGSGMTIRTNAGSLQFKPNDISVLSVDSDSVDMAKEVYAKVGLKTGGNVYSDTAVTDNLGTGALPWKAAYSKQFTVAGEASKTYGYLTTQTVGTADTVGVCRLSLGNSTASGTASNAKGQILIYGTNTAYTNLTPSNNSTTSNAVTLPSGTGYLPLMSKGDTSYWGMLAPDGNASNWIRTTSAGLIPVDQNGTSALGTSSWPFGNIYGTTIYEDGTALSNKYAPKSHTHSYLPLSGGTMTGSIKIGGLTNSWVGAAKDSKAVISSNASAGNFHPLYTYKTTNGSMVLAGYQSGLQVSYLTKAHVDAGENTVSESTTLIDESGSMSVGGNLAVNGGNVNNIRQINFRAHSDDGAYIRTVIDGNQTYLDFVISDDAGTDRFRWVGNLYNSSDGTHPDEVAMELYPHLNGGSELYMRGHYHTTGYIYMDTNNTSIFGKATDGSNRALLRLTNNNVTDVGNTSGATCLLGNSHPTHYDGSATYTLHSDKNHSWGYYSTNGGQDFLGRGKRCMVATEGDLIINYESDFTQTRFHGIVQVDGHIKIGSTPVSVQSGAPTVGGVWIQI